MGRLNSSVDAFLERQQRWGEEYAALRGIVLGCNLDEDLKWGVPCYALGGGGKVVLIHGFKHYCALLFFKGALLDDPENILVQQTGNVQAARQIRFTDSGQIAAMAPVLKDYIERAIAVEKSGATVAFKQTGDFPVAEAFQTRLDADPTLKNAFSALTPGRQRAWLLHFAAPKQAATRAARAEKAIPDILAGKGPNERS
jgi:uncharacterized protein YdeI (YjbR/CyaY-like superfamily)